jgi:hypothetical protein
MCFYLIFVEQPAIVSILYLHRATGTVIAMVPGRRREAPLGLLIPISNSGDGVVTSTKLTQELSSTDVTCSAWTHHQRSCLVQHANTVTDLYTRVIKVGCSQTFIRIDEFKTPETDAENASRMFRGAKFGLLCSTSACAFGWLG